MKVGVYERLLVMDTTYENRPTRMMRQDRAVSGYMFLDTGETAKFTQYVAAADCLSTTPREGLVIGGGGYLAPKLMLNIWPTIHVDVAEIEPSLINVAHDFFDLPETPRLTNHVSDGRRYLHDSGKKFDVIFSDVFYALAIPPHIATKEFFTLAKQQLSPGGVFMANFVGDLVQQPPNILFSEIRTLKSVFPNCYFFAVTSRESQETQSIIAFAINGSEPLDFSSTEITKNSNPIVRDLVEHRIDMDSINLQPYVILTDNYAPAEYLAMSTLKRELER
jgi:spermidine synthase